MDSFAGQSAASAPADSSSIDRVSGNSVPRYQRFQLWLMANLVTMCICLIMIAAGLFLWIIETAHSLWPSRLNWLSDSMYHNIPYLSDIFSNETTRANIKSIEEIADSCDIDVADYIATCGDGHLLTVHRFQLRRSEPSSNFGPPVLLLHGLLQDSDSFSCSGKESLVFALLKEGHDVWCGNNRGTKYSSRHTGLPSDSDEYWDFNIDHLARFDVPAMVDAVLEHSEFKALTLVGFSQGSAQSFAALSLSPELNAKVALFVALAPAVQTAAVGGFISHLAIAYPDILTSVFGKQSFLPIVLGWQRILSPRILERVVSSSMLLLFGWDCKEMRKDRRQTLYQYVYSLSSVQCVSHWFHILGQNCGRLCSFGGGDYDLSHISTPVALLSGKRDLIIDTSSISSGVQQCIHEHVEDEYEHLDMIWADSAHIKIFPKIISLIEQHAHKSKNKK